MALMKGRVAVSRSALEMVRCGSMLKGTMKDARHVL